MSPRKKKRYQFYLKKMLNLKICINWLLEENLSQLFGRIFAEMVKRFRFHDEFERLRYLLAKTEGNLRHQIKRRRFVTRKREDNCFCTPVFLPAPPSCNLKGFQILFYISFTIYKICTIYKTRFSWHCVFLTFDSFTPCTFIFSIYANFSIFQRWLLDYLF